ncbi:hypothetical protein H9P43_005159 [Blastocladiella emersonii ATCC 22665]|nr:hypothetical protein H9P43_005159 [Blastocladiella emersonii ATCC 22665]
MAKLIHLALLAALLVAAITPRTAQAVTFAPPSQWCYLANCAQPPAAAVNAFLAAETAALGDGPAKCGNGVCEIHLGETCATCAADCGSCSVPAPIRQCKTKGHMALTFDDGTSEFTDSLIDILGAAKVRATFFVLGVEVMRSPARAASLKKAHDAGHVIGMHTYSHRSLGDSGHVQYNNRPVPKGAMPFADLRAEILLNDVAVHSVIGVHPRFVRPPFPDFNARSMGYLESAGYVPININADTDDWQLDKTARATPENVLAQFRTRFELVRPESSWIHLQHDTLGYSVRATNLIIDYLRSQPGIKLVGLDECLGQDAYRAAGASPFLNPSLAARAAAAHALKDSSTTATATETATATAATNVTTAAATATAAAAIPGSPSPAPALVTQVPSGAPSKLLNQAHSATTIALLVAGVAMAIIINLANVGMVHPSADGSANASRCVDFDIKSANGVSATAQMWACHGHPNPNAIAQLFNRGGEVGSWNYRNGTPAQYWYVDPTDKSMAWRSALNHNLCLDPSGGFNGDRNGQPLILWHCHGGREQRFLAESEGSFKTNGLWDMQRACQAKSIPEETSCTWACSDDVSKGWTQVFFEGVKFMCGVTRSTTFGLVCTSAVAGIQLLQPSDPCSCQCRRITDPGCGPGHHLCFAPPPGFSTSSVGGALNSTLEALIAKHENEAHLRDFVPLHPELHLPATLVPIASIIKENPSLATKFAVHPAATDVAAAAVVTSTTRATAPTPIRA